MDDNENNGIDQESFFGGCLTALILSGVGWMFLLLILSGCSPRIVETVRTEYVYQDRIERDTTIVHDSVHVREFVKGDTIRITEYRDHLVYRYKSIRDTLLVRDSIPVPYPVPKEVTKEVEKPLSAGQKAKIGAFWYLVLAVAGLGLWTFRKPLLKLITKI